MIFGVFTNLCVCTCIIISLIYEPSHEKISNLHTDWFVSDLVINPNCWFSRAQAIVVLDPTPMIYTVELTAEVLVLHMSLCMRKPTIWVPIRSDTNRTVQSQKKARSLKFWI